MAVGAGVAAAAAAAAAAAGYYFYASKDAKQNRKIAARWAADLKNDVVRETKKLKNVSREDVLEIVDRAAEAYETARNVNIRELLRAAKELKTNWRVLADEARINVKVAAKKAPAKRTSAKTAPKKRRSK